MPGLPAFTVKICFTVRSLKSKNGRTQSWSHAMSFELKAEMGQKWSVSQWLCRNGNVSQHVTVSEDRQSPFSISFRMPSSLSDRGILNARHTCLSARFLRGTVLGPVLFCFVFLNPGVLDSQKMNRRICVILVYFHQLDILMRESLFLLRMEFH